MASEDFESLLRTSDPDVPSVSSYIPQAIGYGTSQHNSGRSVNRPALDMRVRQLRDLQDQTNGILKELLDTFHLQPPRATLSETSSGKELLKQQGRVYEERRYTFVLIDGNHFIFSHMVEKRSGAECAEALIKAIESFSRSSETRVQIYANVERLMQSLGLERPFVYDFIFAFNSQTRDCNFVDADVTAQSLQSKIKATLNEELDALYCCHIVLGIPPDQGYAAILNHLPVFWNERLYLIKLTGALWPNIPDRVRDLRTVPLDSILSLMKDVPKKDSVDDAFDTMLVPVAVESCNASSTTTAPAVSSKGTPALQSSRPAQSTTWASVAAQNWRTRARSNEAHARVVATPQQIAMPDLLGSAVRTVPRRATVKPGGTIERNRNGERIDRMDKSIPYKELGRVKSLRLCNAYYLLGPDHCDGYCRHSHSYPISAGEKMVLREVARTIPCHQRTACEDPKCMYGHRCPQSKVSVSDCYWGDTCKFHGWGHGIDTKVARVITS